MTEARRISMLTRERAGALVIETAAAALVISELARTAGKTEIAERAGRTALLMRGMGGFRGEPSLNALRVIPYPASSEVAGLLRDVADTPDHFLAPAAEAVLTELTNETAFREEIATAKSLGAAIPDTVAMLTKGDMDPGPSSGVGIYSV